MELPLIIACRNSERHLPDSLSHNMVTCSGPHVHQTPYLTIWWHAVALTFTRPNRFILFLVRICEKQVVQKHIQKPSWNWSNVTTRIKTISQHSTANNAFTSNQGGTVCKKITVHVSRTLGLYLSNMNHVNLNSMWLFIYQHDQNVILSKDTVFIPI